MRVQCPKCEFSGNIRDELIPPEGKNVNCPKCKTRIFVKNENAPEPSLKTHLPISKESSRKQINTVVAIVGFAICIGMGILIGTQINRPSKPVANEAPPQPQENTRNPVEIEKATPPPTAPVPKESDFVSTEYVDDFTIEDTIAKTEGMTTIQEEEFLIDEGWKFVHKMIRGDFILEDVFEMNFLFENVYPAGMYSYLIRASSSENYSTDFTIYIGTNNHELIRNIQKDSKAYIEGYIIGGDVDFGSYDFYIANAKIEFL